ncbi:phage tail tape measure protein [Paraburkholderia lycopersici]|uniref:Phage tail tape measure protein, TP901 family, core region n=1 Tax=Paraburkholderia lycopersici TaxID=416944 RepID=A0A1G7CRK2_9BURK|nr:phage tail tape measure protein [Paraburkholderia lycopersici]SDE41937.1 phage tail tape measure protein, TP901 family, core region [Paraburkholderia lycopersici]
MATGNDLKLRVLFDMIDGATKPLRNILNGNKDLAKSLKESRTELGKLQQAQKDVAAFRELRGGLVGSKRDMEAAQARVGELARAINSTDSPTKKMRAEFERAKVTAAKLSQAHDDQATKVRTLRDRLSAAGIDTRNLSQHERDLRSSVSATTAAMTTQQNRLAELTARTKRLGEAREKLNKTKETAGKLAGTGAGMMAGGAVLGAATLVPVAEYAKAEDSATQLASALMRAGGVVPPEFEKINTLAMKLGDRLPGTTADFQDMMTMLTRQGISAQAILGGMGEATAYLGVQLKKTPAEAAEFTAKLQDATRTTEKDMLSLTDVIQKAFMLGVDDNNMLQGFAKLGPAMDTIKQKGLEGAKALAPLLVMADQSGMEGSAAGNAYRKVFQLGMDAKKVAKANKQLAPGQKLDFTNGKGEFGGLDNMFTQFAKLQALNTQKRLGVMKEIFGDDAETLQVISLMIEKGKAGYDEVQAKMAAQASMQERVNKQLGTLKNLWEAAGGTFTNGLVAFGDAVAPEVKGIVEWLGDMSQKMGNWARENPRLANGLMKVAAVIAIVMTVIGGLLVVVAAVLAPLGAIAFAFTAIGAAGLATVGIVAGVAVGIIAAVAAAAVAIYTYWEPIKAFFAGLWDGIRAVFDSAVIWFSGLPAQFSAFGANIVSGLVNGITSGLGAVQSAITNVADSTVGWFKEKLGIHSPSRVFGELGGFITQGAAIGMEAEQGRVAKAAVGLATLAATTFAAPGAANAAGTPFGAGGIAVDTRPALAARQAAGTAAGAASPAGGDTYVFNITGADPKAIADQVRQAIEQIERKKQSQRASRLTD